MSAPNVRSSTTPNVTGPGDAHTGRTRLAKLARGPHPGAQLPRVQGTLGRAPRRE